MTYFSLLQSTGILNKVVWINIWTAEWYLCVGLYLNPLTAASDFSSFCGHQGAPPHCLLILIVKAKSLSTVSGWFSAQIYLSYYFWNFAFLSSESGKWRNCHICSKKKTTRNTFNMTPVEPYTQAGGRNSNEYTYENAEGEKRRWTDRVIHLLRNDTNINGLHNLKGPL